MFTRSAAACQTDPENISKREQLNLITSYIDGSQIYGSSKTQAESLREFSPGNVRGISSEIKHFSLHVCKSFS